MKRLTTATHWTRALYYDYFGRNDADPAHMHEALMEAHHNSFGERTVLRSPLRAAALLLAIYVTMYLAVGGALYLMHTHDAAAHIVPQADTLVASAPSS